MKYINISLFLISFLLIHATASAQLDFSIVENLHPSHVNLQQLVQIRINNMSVSRNVIVQMELTDNNELIYSANYNTVSLQKGMQILNLGVLRPDYKFFGTSAAAKRLQTTNLLDFGRYKLCVVIIEEQGSIEQCINFAVNSLTPPVLIHPVDESEITTANPLLTWLSPTPMLQGIYYAISLTEVDEGQTAIDAIGRNPLIYQHENILTNSMVYPPTAKPLIQGKNYAWQVEAFINGFSLGKTEVWKFHYKGEEEKRILNSTSYYVVKKMQDGTYCMAKPHLYILVPDVKYRQETNYKISDTEGKSIKLYNRNLSKIRLDAGDNFLSIDLENVADLQDGKFYFMSIPASGTEYKISFQYFKNNKK